MTTPRDRLGSSGVFKAIADSARKIKRAVTGGDDELSPEAQRLGEQIAQAFVAGRFADIYALATPSLQQRTTRSQFEALWRDAVTERGPLTGFEISNAGHIDLGFIPGLEETPQTQFAAFLEIAFSSPTTPIESEAAFAIGAVLLDHAGKLAIGALHKR